MPHSDSVQDVALHYWDARFTALHGTGYCAGNTELEVKMTREEMIRTAREAGLYHFYDSEGQCTGITDARLVTEDTERNDDRLIEMLAPFADLVAAAERERIIAENAPVIEKINAHIKALEDELAAIRARGYNT